jgi:hypothetical protein
MIHPVRVGALLRPPSGLVLSFLALLTLPACAVEMSDASEPEGQELERASTELESGDTAEAAIMEPAVTVASGTVDVTLHPGPSATVGSPTVVTFGMPFAPGNLTSVTKLRATTTSGAELKIHVRSLLPWRVWPGRTGYVESVRAAQVSVEVTFATRTPMTIRLHYGTAPTLALPAPPDPMTSWVAVTDGSYPSGVVREPRVYATFPPTWLSGAILRTRTTGIGDAAWSWFDSSMVGSARTAVNDVPASVTERINYTTDYEPWLFDRTATLFGVYARTGDVKWMRNAHRSAQFYLKHVNSSGYFDLKNGDLKYSYGRSLLMDFLFTGDPALIAAIQRIASAGTSWNPVYTISTNFWTERHQTYALLAALAAWEATGSTTYSTRARAVASASFAMALDPYGSWHVDKCMLHGMTAHEGSGGDSPVCSPWMSALFADAVWEYYLMTNEQGALTFLANLGDYVKTYGLYSGGEGLSYSMPWYLASSMTTFSDEGPWGDIEHTCDVAGLVARGAWARKALGGDPAPLRATAQALLTGCRWNLEYWHRPNGPASGKSEWRITPGRKFNWWFGSTSDLPRLMLETQ